MISCHHLRISHRRDQAFRAISINQFNQLTVSILSYLPGTKVRQLLQLFRRIEPVPQNPHMARSLVYGMDLKLPVIVPIFPLTSNFHFAMHDKNASKFNQSSTARINRNRCAPISWFEGFRAPIRVLDHEFVLLWHAPDLRRCRGEIFLLWCHRGDGRRQGV